MKIPIGKYYLLSNPTSFTVCELRAGFNRGEPVENQFNVSYHPTIESALNNLVKRGLIESDATTLAELKADLDRIKTKLWDVWHMNVV